MEIEYFSPKPTKDFMREVMESVAEIAAKHGLTVGNKKANASPGVLEFKLVFKTKNATEMEKAVEQKTFEARCELYGLKPEDFGRQFQHGRRTYTIVGLNLRCTKRPIEARRDDGKIVRFSHGKHMDFENVQVRLPFPSDETTSGNE